MLDHLNWVLSVTYLWLKAGHVIFVIFWMAGLFMLPRLFVYHQESAPESPDNAQWIAREQRLLRIIMWPSMTVSWALGLILAWQMNYFTLPWFHVKLAAVLGLSAYQFWLASYAATLAQGQRRWSGRMLRIVNEVPGLAAAVIVIMVIVRPF